MKDILLGIISVLGVVGLIVILTPLSVFFGWITGHIIKWFCGDFVADGLNTLFGTARFTKDMLPLIGGVLGFIGSFFRATSTRGKRDND